LRPRCLLGTGKLLRQGSRYDLGQGPRGQDRCRAGEHFPYAQASGDLPYQGAGAGWYEVHLYVKPLWPTPSGERRSHGTSRQRRNKTGASRYRRLGGRGRACEAPVGHFSPASFGRMPSACPRGCQPGPPLRLQRRCGHHTTSVGRHGHRDRRCPQLPAVALPARLWRRISLATRRSALPPVAAFTFPMKKPASLSSPPA